MPAQCGRAEDAHATEGQQQNGDLEHRAEREHRHELEPVVGARLNQGVERTVVEPLEESDSRRQDQEVGEADSGCEERRGEDQQRLYCAPVGRRDRRGDERPYLREKERQIALYRASRRGCARTRPTAGSRAAPRAARTSTATP